MKVTSSNVKNVEYDAATRVLTVQFNSGGGQYSDVGPEVWEKLQELHEQGGSIGSFLARSVKGQYAYEREKPIDSDNQGVQESGSLDI